MSNDVFPVLPGLQFDLHMKPKFSTKIQTAVSGKEYRSAFYQYPLYTFEFSYDLLRDSAAFLELQKVIGFFNKRQGSFDNFLFNNTNDYVAASQNFGTGDGNTTTFQLKRTYGDATFNSIDLVQNVNAANSVYDGARNVPIHTGANNCTISSTGLVTFNVAPSLGNALTWNGTYYYRCRFVADEIDLKNFMTAMWDLTQLAFIGSPQNKV